jgi:bacillithiol system protein YtxJ
MNNNWKILKTEAELGEAIENSYEKPVAFFKHSVSCGISARAMYLLEEEWNLNEKDVDFYYLDLINYRAVSNAIASRLNVTHQSPQIIVVKDGKSVYNVSHHRISMRTLQEGLQIPSNMV